MNYYLDTEFHEDGKTIDLISIGIVSEDGRTYYAINADCDWDRINTLESCQWLRENVMPTVNRDDGVPCGLIAADVLAFIGDDKPTFWGYFSDYDWVVFCQLFGRMIDLPKGFPMFCCDLKQLCVDLGNPELPQQVNGEHNALEDAKWNRAAHVYLKAMQTESDHDE